MEATGKRPGSMRSMREMSTKKITIKTVKARINVKARDFDYVIQPVGKRPNLLVSITEKNEVDMVGTLGEICDAYAILQSWEEVIEIDIYDPESSITNSVQAKLKERRESQMIDLSKVNGATDEK